MAKKNFEELEAQLNIENNESNGTQEQVQEAKVNNSVKNVKIHIMEAVDCYVGGNHYSFAKGKEVSVPADVAAILTNSQKAYRI